MFHVEHSFCPLWRKMKRVIDSFKQEIEYKKIISDKLSKRGVALVGGLSGSAETVFIASLADDLGGLLCIALPDETSAMKLRSELSDMVKGVYYYPPRELILSDYDSSSHEWEQIRISSLFAILSGKCRVLITTAEALLQPAMPANVLKNKTLTLEYGKDASFDDAVRFLSECGYTRCDMVESKSQYAVRGGIIDVFPPFCSSPVRIEFFGDSVDSIAEFDIISQRRGDDLHEITLYPCRELLMDENAKGKIISELSYAIDNKKAQIEKEKQKVIKEKKKSSSEEKVNLLLSDIAGYEHTLDSLKNAKDRISSGMDFPFEDIYLRLVYDDSVSVFDYFPKNTSMYVKDYKNLLSAASAYEYRISEAVDSILEKGFVSGKYAEYCEPADNIKEYLELFGGVVQNNLTSSVGDLKYDGLYSFTVKHGAQGGYDISLLCDDIAHYKRLGYKIFIATARKEGVLPLADMLSERGVKAFCNENYEPNAGEVCIVIGKIDTGYESPMSKTVVMCDVRAQGEKLKKPVSSVLKAQKKEIAAKYKNNTQKIISYADLEVGDYVVHASYGIGIFGGIESITDKNVTKDYIKIKYSGTDVLFVPVSQLDMVSKYIGAGSSDAKLKLSKLSGTDWSRAKAAVKAQVKDMAEKLVKLYAERKETKGFAFSPDTEWQQEFESNFEYEETDGQLIAINEIKADMESDSPMDRLLCGDVGFGKTEVAVRAAFKAVSDGKQVAILVPTTILAWQHYQTLMQRMNGYPVRIALMNRFVDEKKQNDNLKHLERGDIDIVVGTHRLLQKDIKFKDLGLLIIDEEQRFGVEQKEILKMMFKNVDVLTLSATPIPRTLNMAMSGIRDMSVLDEAPGDRYPVQSYVCEYDDAIIDDAISRELARGGQVFYLVNRVASLRNVASHIQEAHPDANIAFAHGNIDEDALSNIWQALVAGEIDILVCTTIIETGIDVPNANTLIIEHAERMGLSQLHQLRGRVGRSSRRAFAYFTYPSGKSLTEEQTKRLTAIRDYTEFGAGFKIAMRDLEIRGAGNILGAEQHGQISAVGYDLYVKILDEAVRELKIEKGDEKAKETAVFHEVTVDLPVNAYIPKDYILSERLRIDVYRKIASISSSEEMELVIDELCDRFSDIPPQVMSLIGVAYVRSLAMRAKIDSIKTMDGNIVIFPSAFSAEDWGRLATEKEYYGKILLSPSGIPHLTYKMQKEDKNNHLKILEKMLTKLLSYK